MTPKLRRGFTLIEVLVALTIVAIALAAGIKAAGSLTQNAQRIEEVTAAQWCAENQLSAIRLSKQFPDIGDAEFSCEQLGATYKGKLLTRPTPNPLFRRVDARIFNEQDSPVLRLSTVVGK